MTTYLLLFPLLGCSGSKLPTHTIRIEDQALRVEVASTPEQRGQGLMFRDSLGADRGMIFVYPDVRPRSFWMKDTRIPLSIAFVDSEGRIVKLADMQPLSQERIPSLYPARYAIEVNQGWFEAHGIERGAVVRDLPEVEPK